MVGVGAVARVSGGGVALVGMCVRVAWAVMVVGVVGVLASVAFWNVAVIVPKYCVVEAAVVLGVQAWDWGGRYASCLSS